MGGTSGFSHNIDADVEDNLCLLFSLACRDVRCNDATVGFDVITVLRGDKDDAETCDTIEFLRSDSDCTLSNLRYCRDCSNVVSLFRISSLRFRNAIVSRHTTRLWCCGRCPPVILFEDVYG